MKRKPDKTSQFGQRLRGLRNENGYSMDSFCEMFNKSQNSVRLNKGTVWRYENGEQEPMVSTVALIAKFFRVSPTYLIGTSDDRNWENGIADIRNSAVVQGSSATTIIARNGGAKHDLDEQEAELLRILSILDVKGRTALMSYAFELEEKQNSKK